MLLEFNLKMKCYVQKSANHLPNFANRYASDILHMQLSSSFIYSNLIIRRTRVPSCNVIEHQTTKLLQFLS